MGPPNGFIKYVSGPERIRGNSVMEVGLKKTRGYTSRTSNLNAGWSESK